MKLCRSVQWPPGRFSRITLSPCRSTLERPTFSPSLSAQTREGRHRRVARASPKMGEEREDLGPGMERRKAVVSLSLCFQLLTPLPCWLGCREMAWLNTSSLSSSLALVSTLRVAPVLLPSPTPATGTEKGEPLSSNSLPRQSPTPCRSWRWRRPRVGQVRADATLPSKEGEGLLQGADEGGGDELGLAGHAHAPLPHREAGEPRLEAAAGEA